MKRFSIPLPGLRSRRPLSGVPVTATPHRWLSPVTPPTGEVCLFVAMCRDGAFADFTLDYVSALAREGFAVVVVAVVDNIDGPMPVPPEGSVGVLVRENAGFDFAAWATVLRLWPELYECDMVVFANDSVFGPFDGFADMIAALRTSSADAVALTESREVRPHFQSYFFALKGSALRSGGVRRFWEDVKILPKKWDVTRRYEVNLLSVLMQAGLETRILFPLPPVRRVHKVNPTLTRWRELIDIGFPFMKVAALRDPDRRVDLAGWESVLLARGADIDRIKQHLATVAPNAPALAADA